MKLDIVERNEEHNDVEDMEGRVAEGDISSSSLLRCEGYLGIKSKKQRKVHIKSFFGTVSQDIHNQKKGGNGK